MNKTMAAILAAGALLLSVPWLGLPHFYESFLYLVSKGALDWGPAKRIRPRLGQVGPQRTSATTVRRVGLEGRETEEAAA